MPVVMTSALGMSIRPLASAAQVAGSSAKTSARPVRLSALQRVSVSAAAISAAA